MFPLFVPYISILHALHACCLWQLFALFIALVVRAWIVVRVVIAIYVWNASSKLAYFLVIYSSSMSTERTFFGFQAFSIMYSFSPSLELSSCLVGTNQCVVWSSHFDIAPHMYVHVLPSLYVSMYVCMRARLFVVCSPFSSPSVAMFFVYHVMLFVRIFLGVQECATMAMIQGISISRSLTNSITSHLFKYKHRNQNKT
jgi:hypothetical protein